MYMYIFPSSLLPPISRGKMAPNRFPEDSRVEAFKGPLGRSGDVPELLVHRDLLGFCVCSIIWGQWKRKRKI